MDGILDALANILLSPFLVFILIVAAIALSVISLVFTLILARKVSVTLTSITTTPPPTPVSTAPSTKPSTGVVGKPTSTDVIRITSGLESLEEISSALAVNSILLFNLAGMSIEAHNIKDEEKLAAILADIVASFRKNGFPAETISIKDSIQGYILSVTKVGEMEVYALVLGEADAIVDVEEARQLLKNFITSIVKKGG
ncbi:MAG: hypothetical protein QXK19_07210 [Nitrososphaerota archaeon]